jgi:hypothetical protein
MSLYGVYITPARFARNIDQGKPIVEAVYRYRSAIGLYPDTLGDMIPAYLVTLPKDWRYTPPSGGRPPRLQLRGGFHSYLSYYFAHPIDSKLPQSAWPEGWGYDQEGTLHFQGKDKVAVPSFEKENDDLVTARIQELRRRVRAGAKDSGLLNAYKPIRHFPLRQGDGRYLSHQKPGGTPLLIGAGGLLTARHKKAYAIVGNDPDTVVVGEGRTVSFKMLEADLGMILEGCEAGGCEPRSQTVPRGTASSPAAGPRRPRSRPPAA